VNCAAIPKELLENELFGYVKGAHGLADRARPGRFEQANQGTILLDEIGDMPPETQVKVLRVIQDKKVKPLGPGSKDINVDVRIVAATHQDLEKLTKAGAFREDLYYRLKVVTIKVPPLRDRLEDIRELAHHFIDRL